MKRNVLFRSPLAALCQISRIGGGRNRLTWRRLGQLSGTTLRQRIGPFAVALQRDATGVWLNWSIWGTGLRGRIRLWRAHCLPESPPESSQPPSPRRRDRPARRMSPWT